MKFVFSVAIASLIALTPASAQSAGAKKFLEDLSGKFKGLGEVSIGSSDSKERVSCRLTNELNKDAVALNIGGACATTQGKVSVDGTLKISGETIVGSFLSTTKNSEITQSKSSFTDDTLTLSMSMVNKNTGNLSRTRQVVSRNGSGFASKFYEYDNASKSYKETGTVEFKPIGS